MALFGNGNNYGNPCIRVFGAGVVALTTYPSALVSNFHQGGFRRNSYWGTGINSNYASIPSGKYNSYAWMMPAKAGAIASHRTIIGEGDLTAAITGGRNGAATLAGSGSLTAIGQLVVSLAATLAGSGDITAADLRAFLNASATLSGSGDITAALLGAKADISANLSGAGGIDAVATALGTMAATITSSGDLLTTSNVGNAVLDALNGVEDDWTLRQALRIILSALGGKVDITGNTVTIRDVNDTVDRITATTDTNGQRTAVTLDAD
jgi:hypothetical protein